MKTIEQRKTREQKIAEYRKDDGDVNGDKDADLYAWAYVAPQKVEQLADLALPEKWYYGEFPIGDHKMPILNKYLFHTFGRLAWEEKIEYAEFDKGIEYAAFNTGLVNKAYEYIYAFLEKNKDRTKPQYWYLKTFVIAGENAGKKLTAHFNPLPKKANYFENPIDMFYDTTKGEPTMDIEHFIVERIERFPKQFIEDNCQSNPELLEIDRLTITDAFNLPLRNPKRVGYFTELGKRVDKNPRIYNNFKNRLSDAVKLAVKRVEWNYKTAVPMYYPTKKTNSLLLPLALTDDRYVDVALVVERQPSGAYQGQTILTLQMAYEDSRLITRPDSDWLRTELIKSTSEIEGSGEKDVRATIVVRKRSIIR